MADNSFSVYLFHPVIVIPRHRLPSGGRVASARQVRGGGGGGGADLLFGERAGAEEDTGGEERAVKERETKIEKLIRRRRNT